MDSLLNKIVTRLRVAIFVVWTGVIPFVDRARCGGRRIASAIQISRRKEFMRFIQTLGMALTSLVLLLCSLPAARAQANASDADSAAIRQLVENYSDGFNRHDAHAVAALFAEDGDFTNMRGSSRHGRKEIEANYAALFAGVLKDAHRVDTVKSVRTLSADIGAVDGFWEMTGTRAADGTENPLRKGLFDFVLTRQNGRWLIAIFHEADIIASPVAPAAK